jgi:hypothetical protein
MNKLAELLGLRAQIAELESEINNETVTFTKDELIDFTKTISNAVANGVKFELSKIDNFDFKSALFTVKEEGELVIKVSRTKVVDNIIGSIDWELNDENVEDVVENVLESLGK